MKYTLGAAFLVILGTILLRAPVALAHFPATDKAMTVTLHIDPGDQPIAGQPAVLNFIYDDQLGKFTFQKCTCTVSIYEQGRQLFSGPSDADSTGVFGSSLPYIFGKADVYTIDLSGAPKDSGDFVPFKVSWNIRVTPDPSAEPNHEVYYIIGFIGSAIVFAGIIGYFIYKDFKDV